MPMLQGSQLALEEWNARGGYLKRKIPFELVVSNDNGLWGSSGNEIIKQAYKDEVWGILGTIDGANSHIAIRVALKAEVADDQHRRHRPDVHRDEHPVGRARDRRRPAAGLPADRLLVPQAEPASGWRSSARATATAASACARSATARGACSGPVPIEMAYKVGQKDFQPRGRAREEREPRRGRALGRRRRGRPDPQHDARDGHDAALLRLRPHGQRRVREDRREERRGRGRRRSRGTPSARTRSSSASRRPTASASASRPRPTPRTPTTA